MSNKNVQLMNTLVLHYLLFWYFLQLVNNSMLIQISIVDLFALGMIAFILSIWSVCGQQDRHLSRKFGNAVYWISLLAITFAFLLLFTLFLYFTYRYLTHPFINHSN